MAGAMTQSYVILAIISLAAIAVLVFLLNRRSGRKRLSTLSAVAFAFIVAGITFGDDPVTGYGLLGTGVAIAVIDAVRKMKKR